MPEIISDVLRTIIAYKREEVAAARIDIPSNAIEADARDAPSVRPFARALEKKIADGSYALIAEIKKASPSKGLIRADFDPPALARAYDRGGAACLSVLTDGPSFQGAADHLRRARAACALPVLRKDFMIDPYQVIEARAMGADCILLILAAIDDVLARELAQTANEWALDVLIEVHDEAELERALALPGRLIGINNRDLRNFHTSLDVSERLIPRVPPERIALSESGISEHADLQRLAACGARAFLVGESLMRHADVSAATMALLGRTSPVDSDMRAAQ